MSSSEPEVWEVQLTVLIPRAEAKTDDEAIDLVGEKLKPWYWTGQFPMDLPME